MYKILKKIFFISICISFFNVGFILSPKAKSLSTLQVRKNISYPQESYTSNKLEPTSTIFNNTPILSQNLALVCGNGILGSSIFADSSAGPGGSGTYSDPYGTLADVENRLENDNNVRKVCLTGFFSESLDLGSAASNELHIIGYQGGATLHSTGESYAIKHDPFSYPSSHLNRLSFENLHLEGYSYGASRIEYLDEVSFKNVSVDGTGAPYGLKLNENGQVILQDVLIENTDYSLINTQYNDEVFISNSTLKSSNAYYGYSFDGDKNIKIEKLEIQDVTSTGIGNSSVGTNTDFISIKESNIAITGSYGITLEVNYAVIEDNTLSGYSYAGIRVTASNIEINKNILNGSGSYFGMTLIGANNTLIKNNFLMDHKSVAIDVGELNGHVYLYNNSFSNNHYGLDIGGGGPHLFYVYSYNNIFYSRADQSAYKYNSFDPNPEVCEACYSEAGSPFDNFDVELYSDYNLFFGNVTKNISNGDLINFTQWQSWGFDQHSLEDDPLFISSSDLHLQNTSPAINVGKSFLYQVGYDIDGQSRGTYYDIGADELKSKLDIHQGSINYRYSL